jgi:hypothetical protein
LSVMGRDWSAEGREPVAAARAQAERRRRSTAPGTGGRAVQFFRDAKERAEVCSLDRIRSGGQIQHPIFGRCRYEARWSGSFWFLTLDSVWLKADDFQSPADWVLSTQLVWSCAWQMSRQLAVRASNPPRPELECMLIAIAVQCGNIDQSFPISHKRQSFHFGRRGFDLGGGTKVAR